MKFIANIVTDSVYDNMDHLLNVVTDFNDIVEGIPTLIIGWKKVKEIFPQTSIIDWEIEENIFWTFSEREKRSKFEKDIIKFNSLIINKFIKTINYTFFNLLTEEKEEKVKFIENLKNGNKKTVILNNDMAYIYNEGTNDVIGISLRDIDYENKDRKKIFNIIYKTDGIILYQDKDIPFSVKKWFKNSYYVMPYIYS